MICLTRFLVNSIMLYFIAWNLLSRFPLFPLTLLSSFIVKVWLMVWMIDCVELRFYGQVNPLGSCRAQSVYLTTVFLNRLSSLSERLTSTLAHSVARNWRLPFLNQRKGDNDRRKYFIIHLPERMLPDPAVIEGATSWSSVGRAASDWATEAGITVWQVHETIDWNNICENDRALIKPFGYFYLLFLSENGTVV